MISAPATRTDSINPSELIARGAALQASLIAEYDQEDITESCHPVVTATPHLSTALGVLCFTDDPSRGVFVPIVENFTPVPCRRTGDFAVPGAGGDVLIKLVEATSRIHKKTIEPTSKKSNHVDEPDSDLDDDSDEEPEEVKEKKWTVGQVVAEAAIRGTKKGDKIEIQVDVGPEMQVSLVAREATAKGGVRGVVPGL